MRGVVDGCALDVVRTARAEGRTVLLDPEAFTIVRDLGIAVPAQRYLDRGESPEVVDLEAIPGDRVVVKVVSPDVPHRSDAGGVAFVDKTPAAVAGAVDAMRRAFAGVRVSGYTVNECIEHESGFGRELLLGLRRTDDFGMVVTFGPGGLYAEHLARAMAGAVTVLSPSIPPRSGLGAALSRNPMTPVLRGELRGQAPMISPSGLDALVSVLLEFASGSLADDLAEFEINPAVLTDRGPVALDVLVRLSSPRGPLPPERPVWKIGRLLRPGSAAIIGVSRKMNVGHIILNNMLDEGFDRSRLWVVKPGEQRLHGCRCVPDVTSLPERVDLFVIAVDAGQVPEVIRDIVSTRRAESVIVIPGGLGERSGSEPLVERMNAAMAEARRSEWHGPVINGGNCLGIRSKPGRYDTMFIPKHKLPPTDGPVDPVALISQSGAFAVASLSKMAGVNPKFVVTLGNQHDLTAGDYLGYLADDDDLKVFACYVEGFRPGDGIRFMRTAMEIVDGGRTVVLYRAGRTDDGARASSSHTASVAGDYAVARALAEHAGVVVADSLADFADLTRLFAWLGDKSVAGMRLGAMSNAGFECVAIADNLGGFVLSEYSPGTRRRLEALFGERRLSAIVEARNPLDVTPILEDGGFEQVARAVVEDDGIDVAVIGCVPLSGAIETVPAGEGHGEDVLAARSVAGRLAELHGASRKAWVCVVDGGPRYDAMAEALESRRVPTFRSADRALGVFERFCRSRLGG